MRIKNCMCNIAQYYIYTPKGTPSETNIEIQAFLLGFLNRASGVRIASGTPNLKPCICLIFRQCKAFFIFKIDRFSECTLPYIALYCPVMCDTRCDTQLKNCQNHGSFAKSLVIILGFNIFATSRMSFSSKFVYILAVKDISEWPINF